MSSNRTPLTTRPSSTSRQGMIRLAGTGPEYVSRDSTQVAGAHAHGSILDIPGRRPCEGQDVKQSGGTPTGIAERDVLNVDRVSRGWIPTTPHDQLNRRRTREDPQTLDQRAFRRASRLTVR